METLRDTAAVHTHGASRLPRWVDAAGIVAIAGSLLLAARLVWEQTVWTWSSGPQLVGSSLAHGGGLALFVFPVMLLGWLLVSVVVTLYDWLGRRRIGWLRGAGAAAGIAIVAVLHLPYGFWQRTFVDRMSPERVSEVFVFAAAAGDLDTVKVLHARGVAVNSRVNDGATALHAAAASGRVDLVEYLLAHGADPSLRSDAGRTALDRAKELERTGVARVLAERAAAAAEAGARTLSR
jgi:hypothetical protein